MGKNPKANATIEKNKPIHFKLDELLFGLSTNAPLVDLNARQFLAAFILTEDESETAGPVDVHLHLDLVDSLANPPDEKPIYIGDSRQLTDGVGTLFVYQQPAGFLLYFQHGGLVNIKTTTGSEQMIQGLITAELLKHGRLHDLLFTTLSCFLRRNNYYLIHASAAVNHHKAVIFVGPSGCGKSTTALNLALNGWTMLSNDTLLLQERPDGIYALPTPGGFSVRPASINHIPALAAYLPQPPLEDFYHLSLHRLGLAWAKPTPISTIFFPEIINDTDNKYEPLSPTLALAHLMELSLDRWDKSTLPDHFAFLERLSMQASAAVLKIANQPRLIELINQRT